MDSHPNDANAKAIPVRFRPNAGFRWVFVASHLQWPLMLGLVGSAGGSVLDLAFHMVGEGGTRTPMLFDSELWTLWTVVFALWLALDASMAIGAPKPGLGDEVNYRLEAGSLYGTGWNGKGRMGYAMFDSLVCRGDYWFLCRTRHKAIVPTIHAAFPVWALDDRAKSFLLKTARSYRWRVYHLPKPEAERLEKVAKALASASDQS